LNDLRRKARFGKFVGAPGAREKASLVDVRLGLYQKCPRQI
jgi:hypothetical protein